MNMPIGNSLGFHIRGKRESAGVSMRAVASAAGLSVAFLCDLELGRRSAKILTLGRIAKALSANGIPTSIKELTEIQERDKIAVLEAELTRLKRKRA